MPADRAAYLRWIGLAAMLLVVETSIALIAFQVAGRSPALIAAPSTSPSPNPPPGTAFPPPSSAPSPSSTTNGQSAPPWAAAAFYPPSKKVVLFGGVAAFSLSRAPQASSDTWTWDGANWSQLHPVNSPPARYAAGLVYDELHQVLVLYGGQGDGQAFLNDTWTWDGANWKQMSPSENPPQWMTAPMTYDATRKAVLMFVGVGDWPTTPPDQTWSWDGGTWTRVPTATDPVSNAIASAGTVAYDSATAQTLFVGASGTWVLEAAGWRRLAGGGTTTREFAVADDPASGVLVEVGANGDTWTWDGKVWTAQNPSVAPPPRSGEAIAYDPIHQQVDLFGGALLTPGSGLSAVNGVWVWDGKTWKQAA